VRILIAKGQSKAPCCCTALRVFDTQAAGGMIGYVGERASSVSTFFDYEWSALNNNLGPPPPVAVPPSGLRADAMKRQSDSFLDSNKSG